MNTGPYEIICKGLNTATISSAYEIMDLNLEAEMEASREAGLPFHKECNLQDVIGAYDASWVVMRCSSSNLDSTAPERN